MSQTNHDLEQDDLLETPAPDFTVERVKEVVNMLYGLTGELFQLGSERDQNFRIHTASGDQFVIKISNRAENFAVIDMQTKALEHIAAADPELPVPKTFLSRSGLAIERFQAKNGTNHFLRVLTYLPGSPPQDNPTDPALLRPVGVTLARLGLALRGFFHPAASFELLWDLKHASKLKQYVHHIPDVDRRQLASYFLDCFDRNILPAIPKLRAQMIHNDIGPDNMLVAENDPGRIVGLIDFGDMAFTPLVFDLANTIASMIKGNADPAGASVEIVAGYHETTPLEPAELHLLYDLIATRMTMWNVIANWRVVGHPYNREYIMGSTETMWDTLEAWRAQDPLEVTKKFFRACGLWELDTGNKAPKETKERTQSHLLRRDRRLGPCYSLFYNRPLHIVSGEDVWLYDDEGRRYLDVYNNVPHVGHCHPHVVNAIAKQARRLNTNTRYMHGLILELAERISDQMPEPLSVCMFVCTGTEANELAWRLSKLASGNSGALVTRHAYHGNGDATIQFSPEELSAEKLPPNVQTLFAPTSNSSFRQPDSGVSSAIRALDMQGHRTAMLLTDTAFTSDGIYTSPKGYLSTLYAKTRAAGGLCVADEVQAGFGRLGEHFWGFQFEDVVPDIVTMGKPMGNGHPIAAVVTRPEIAAALAGETGYFNTFGGNPVSCAAGLAVLDVIEKEGLQHNARGVGNYLTKRFAALQQAYPMIGEVHGAGLLQGLDIVQPDGSPDPELADQIMNQLRENGVLVGTTGQHGQVLKIRPPIVFQKEHAEILLAALVKTLNEL